MGAQHLSHLPGAAFVDALATHRITDSHPSRPKATLRPTISSVSPAYVAALGVPGQDEGAAHVQQHGRGDFAGEGALSSG